VAIDLGKPTGVFSVEMSQNQLVARLISARAKIAPGSYNEHNRADKGELLRIQRIAMDVAQAKDRLLIDQREGITINQIRAKARRWKREFGIGFIAIDYLQLIRSKSKQAESSREREVAEISSGIKGLAKELGIPIMILAQLNRGPEGRAGKNAGMPRMSDLRESGSIEQDADMIGLLYRHAYYAQDAEAKQEQAGRAQLDLAKNRNGETGIVPLTFIPELTRFETGLPYVPPPQSQEPPSRFDKNRF
jgi:replicative DNA helicase